LYYGEPRLTKDIDITMGTEIEHIEHSLLKNLFFAAYRLLITVYSPLSA
jgi:hypothetical protein